MHGDRDITGQKFGRLTALRPSTRRRHWVLACDCGNEVERTVHSLLNSTNKGYEASCEDCRRARLAARSKGVAHAASDFIKEYKFHRANFSPEQWRRYGALLRGRTDEQDQAEAVDLIMRGTDLLLARSDNSDLHNRRDFTRVCSLMR